MTDLEIYAHISISRASALANSQMNDTDNMQNYFRGYFEACKDIMEWIEKRIDKELEDNYKCQKSIGTMKN